jgi:hypothetical protein
MSMLHPENTKILQETIEKSATNGTNRVPLGANGLLFRENS